MRVFSLLAFLVLSIRPTMADTPLSLKGIAIIGFDDAVAADGSGGWTDEGPENSLQGFPVGSQTFLGVPFDIPREGPAVLALPGKAWPKAPPVVTVPANGATGKTLFVLSAHAWDDPPSELATVTVAYEDGKEDRFSFVQDAQTGPWWYPLSRNQSRVAWRGENRSGVPVGVYLTGLELTRPGASVRSVVLEGAPMRGQLLILGLTLSNQPASLAFAPPAWTEEPSATAGWFEPARAGVEVDDAPVWGAEAGGAATGRVLLMEFGQSLSAPEQKQAEQTVRLLKDLGYTGVRTAPIDPLIAKPSGDMLRTGLRNLLAECEKHGLAISVTLAGGRVYHADEGVAAFRELNIGYPEYYFVDEAATALLERDLGDFWQSFGTSARMGPSAILFEGGLFGYHQDFLTRPHHRMLQNRWCAWLRQCYGSGEKLKEAWQMPGEASPLYFDESMERGRVEFLSTSNLLAASPRFRRRIADQLRFLDQFQSEWFLARRAAAEKILPPAKWSATAWTSPAWLRDLQTRTAASLDVIEERAELVETGTMSDPDRALYLDVSPISAASLTTFRTPFQRVEGKPFIVWDAIGAWPGDRNFVRVLRTLALGAIQGWDGVLHRQLDRFPEEGSPMSDVPLPGRALQNPSVLAILPLGRHLFLRGDLAEAPVVLSRRLVSPDDIASATQAIPAGGNGLPGWLAFGGKVVARLDSGELARSQDAPPDGKISTPDRSLEIDMPSDHMRISTARSVALAGSLSRAEFEDASVILRVADGYGVVYVTTLDGQPITTSRKLLLGFVGRSRNTGQTADRSTEPRGVHPTVWSIRNPGAGPVIMEPVRASVTVKNALAGTWTLLGVDVRGLPLPASPRVLKPASGDKLTLDIDTADARTPLFLLTHE